MKITIAIQPTNEKSLPLCNVKTIVIGTHLFGQDRDPIQQLFRPQALTVVSLVFDLNFEDKSPPFMQVFF